MYRPESIDRADHIGIILKTTFHEHKPGLRLAVARRYMAAVQPVAACILRRYSVEVSAIPRQLVVQLAAELEPDMVEYKASHRCCRVSLCRMKGMEPTMERRERFFSVLRSMPAGFGGHHTVARWFDSSRLLRSVAGPG